MSDTQTRLAEALQSAHLGVRPVDTPSGLSTYGVRYNSDGMKGNGYFGALPAAGGAVSTEISGESNGREYPLMNPAMSQEQLQRLLSGANNIPDIYDTAEAWAQQRAKAGMSPFAQPNELYATPGMVTPKFGTP